MEVLIPFLGNLVSGLIGGNIAGAIFRKFSLGIMGNTLAGMVGGGVTGELVDALISPGFGIGVIGISAEVLIGGIGGAAITMVIGFIRRYVSG